VIVVDLQEDTLTIVRPVRVYTPIRFEYRVEPERHWLITGRGRIVEFFATFMCWLAEGDREPDARHAGTHRLAE
jgi:hypothetical protein